MLLSESYQYNNKVVSNFRVGVAEIRTLSPQTFRIVPQKKLVGLPTSFLLFLLLFLFSSRAFLVATSGAGSLRGPSSAKSDLHKRKALHYPIRTLWCCLYNVHFWRSAATFLITKSAKEGCFIFLILNTLMFFINLSIGFLELKSAGLLTPRVDEN